jgi:beta-lactamase regulating signal transducer with metallopeptidase domain/ankyrin repeat protein
MSEQLVTFFRLVVEASWQSSLIILLILLVRPLMGARIPARWRYWLWAPVLIRLLVPVALLPANPMSIQNIEIVDQPLEQMGLPAVQMSVAEPALVPQGMPMPEPGPVRSTAPMTTISPPVSLWLVISAVWLAGVAIAAGFMAGAQIFLRWRLAKDHAAIDPKIVAIWDRCCHRLHFTRRPTLRMSRDVVSPSLVGTFRPILLLPKKNFTAYSPEDWENIFIHELAHYRCGDHWTNAVQLVAMAVHWFNPLLWMAFRQLRADRELSADEWALQHLDGEGSVAYGETLLKVLVQTSERRPLLSSVGILEDRVQLKERLQRIVRVGPRTLIGSLAGLVIVALVALLVLGRASDKVDLSNYDDMKPTEILISAAHRGDLPVMRKMLAQGVDINALADVDGMNSALSSAAAANQLEAIRLLVAKGADVNRETDAVWSPLKAAMECGWTECAHELLKDGSICSQARLAALDGDQAVLKAALAAHKIDVTEMKVLCGVAASNGRTDCFRLLMQNIRMQPGETYWALDDWHVLFVIARGHRDTLQAVLDESPYANTLNQGGVMRLGPALAENPGMRDWLEAKGYKIPEYTINERLIDAAEHDDIPEMHRLVKQGANVNYLGESSWTPLTKAAAWNKPRAVKFLLAHGADPNSVHLPGWDYSAICLTSKPEIADMVLAAGGNVNAMLYKHTTHIMSYCVTFGPVEMVQWFIDRGVDPSKLTNAQDGQTLLFDAGNAAIVELLIEHGVPVDARSKNGGTALLEACAWNKESAAIAGVLLKHGADPNAVDNNGMTPLMRAKDGATVDVLVKYGADLKVKSKEGASLIEMGGICRT